MPRSLRVKPDCLDRVKLALNRNGFRNQRSLAEEANISLATVSNFLTGKPVDYAIFDELCQNLSLDWKEVANLDFEVPSQIKKSSSETPDGNDANTDTAPCYPNGAVPLGSLFYIERVLVEEQIQREISKPGALVRIKAPLEMGKTSVLLRVLDFAKRQGYSTVSLNLQQVDRAILGDLDRFLRWLCANISRQLHLPSKLDEYWDRDLGSKISCISYIEEYILESVAAPLVLALDETNHIFEHPEVSKDFLPLLRSWYEEAKTLPIWRKLRAIVVHSTEIYIPLQLDQSPFNVGLPVELSRFTLEEVRNLARRYRLDWSNGEEAQQLMDVVGGHPALIHTAIYHLAYLDVTLPQLLETAATSTGIYHRHLQRHWANLEENSELARALDTVMSAAEPIPLAPLVAHKLSSLGLIERSGDKAVPSCELYRRYFL